MKFFVAHNAYSFLKSLEVSSNTKEKEIILLSHKVVGNDEHDFTNIEEAFNVEIIISDEGFNNYARGLQWYIPFLFEFKIRSLIIKQLDFTKYDLYIFNDEEKLSRYIIDKIKSYSLIQEGMANYSDFSHRNSWFRKYNDFIPFLRFTPIPLGRSKKCSKIFYTSDQFPIPIDIRSKSTILWLKNELSKKQLTALHNFFCINDTEKLKKTILMTQPLEVYGCSTSEKIEIYKAILEKLTKTSTSIALKIHPNEDLSPYKRLGIELVPRYPVELISLVRPDITFYSLFSSLQSSKHIRLFSSGIDYEDSMKQRNRLSVVKKLIDVVII